MLNKVQSFYLFMCKYLCLATHCINELVIVFILGCLINLTNCRHYNIQNAASILFKESGSKQLKNY